MTSKLQLPFKPTPHPLVPWFSDAEIVALMEQADGPTRLLEAHTQREAMLARSAADPLQYGFELPNWLRADELLHEHKFVYASGGKRAGKSEWAAKRIVQAAMRYPGGKLWCFQDNERTSISTQQEVVWKYMPPHIKALNEKRSSLYKIKYQQGRGFTEMFCVLPNKTEIHFLTYNQVPEDFQGWELGARVQPGELDPAIQNLGAWADENLTLPWWETLKLRLATRGAKMLWTFSPMSGITPAIKEFRGAAKPLETRPSELLPERINVPNCPTGTMPYIEEPATRNAAVIYFFTQDNPFGNYPEVKALLQGKTTERVMMDAYGYAVDTIGRAFPLFGGWNIVRPEHLPERGTNYMVMDPAGRRNAFLLWVRVDPEGRHFIYREWPDAQRYGEWAVPSRRKANEESRRGLDGDPGPAQRTLGYGVTEYKRLILDEETVRGPDLDPLRASLWTRFGTASGEQGAGIREQVLLRKIDPRAGRNEHIAERGGTCLMDQFAEEHRDVRGDLLPPLIFEAASGVDIEEGVTAVNELLRWERSQPLSWPLNAPRLYVSTACRNVIWALENWTGEDGQTGACKDPIDCIRYMALDELRHIEPGAMKTRGGGSY